MLKEFWTKWENNCGNWNVKEGETVVDGVTGKSGVPG